jgi:hypothetical protein
MLNPNPQAIYAKTKKLVKAIGKWDNFILSTACNLPAENFRKPGSIYVSRKRNWK